MADENIIIEGSVKFRDGKKWKSRWCVMRKLSPVADCVHLQLYRDARARCGSRFASSASVSATVSTLGAGCKASLSLQHFLGAESGFTLDRHSNTLALVCSDLVAVLAFETRERLIQWQVKVNKHVGESRQYVVVAERAGRLRSGPARLHISGRRLALVAGTPPALLALWDIRQLRRYGVVEGRFCWEGGALCGREAGPHAVLSEKVQDIARDVDRAAKDLLTGFTGPESPSKMYRSNTRLSEINTIDSSLPPTDLRLYEDPCIGEEAGAISPYWPSSERIQREMGHGDTVSVTGFDMNDSGTWGASKNVAIERCMSCMSKLGALSRSSTAALTPGAKHFNLAWTMEALQETSQSSMSNVLSSCDSLSRNSNRNEEICRCPDKAPNRPPKPTRLELNLTKKPPMPLPTEMCACSLKKTTITGPYENYDVPRLPSEVGDEYYDTPKRLKECLGTELMQIYRSSTFTTYILKKQCGCLLRLGKKQKEPVVIDSDENFKAASCPCQRVTDWANNWIKLPYCNKNMETCDDLVPNKENMIPSSTSSNALYATIDVTRKTKKQNATSNNKKEVCDDKSNLYTEPANYENMNFALSLEHYENVKDLLKKAGITQTELDAIKANIKPVSFILQNGNKLCTKCGHLQSNKNSKPLNIHDEYLLMEPKSLESNKSLPSGYIPMSPITGFSFHTLKHPKTSFAKLLEEKSASNPTLCNPNDKITPTTSTQISNENKDTDKNKKIQFRKRSSSADSSRFLDDVKEFEGSVGSRGSTSSIETLRNITIEGRTSTPYDCTVDSKLSDADSSEASKETHGKGRGQILVERSSSVPGKGNRDSSSSNDSGVSSCSLRPGIELAEFELPISRTCGNRKCHGVLPRRAKSTDPLRNISEIKQITMPAKSSSAEAEVPILLIKQLRGVVDNHSTSSGTSDMSDYIETLSICSSHSSSDTPITMRVVRHPTSTLRPRSGQEYRLPPAREPPSSRLYYNLP